MNEKQALHTIALTKLPGIGTTIPAAILRSGINAEELLTQKQLPEGLSPQGEKRMAEALKERESAIERAKRELEFAQTHNIKVLCLGSDDYPGQLAECEDPPAVLFFQGKADLNNRHILSIVGTRRITEQGKDLCKQLCTDIAALLPDTIIISGLAYGVDIHCHRAALSANLPTVGVLAHGLDRIYPSMHKQTAIEMTERGGLLTEFTTGTTPEKGNFVRRNRIVAGLSMGTIVVESAIKGGALITAEIANSYSRDVFAFPGRCSDVFSAGCNELIKKNKAALITCAEDVIKSLNWDLHMKKPTAFEQELLPQLSADEKAICTLLKNSEGKTTGELATASGIPFSAVMASLFSLEMNGVVKMVSGSKYRLLR